MSGKARPNEFRAGDDISARKLQDVSRRADLAESITGIGGIKVRTESGRIVIDGGRRAQRPSEPGMIVRVLNTGADEIEPFGAAGIDDNFYTERPMSLRSRVLEVKVPEPCHAGSFVIALNRIPVKQTGLAWFSGICIANIVRQFDGPLVGRVDTIAEEQTLRASANGPARIIWEETYEDEDEHLAVIHWDGRGDTYLDWYNDGAEDVDHGCPCISSGGDGISNDRLGMERPNQDGAFLAMVNVGGTVAPGENGKLLTGPGPFMVRMNSATAALRPAGTRLGISTFAADGIFWRVLAYLGTNLAGEYWAIVQRDTMPPLLKATSDAAGDAISCQTTDEDGAASGTTLILPTAFAP